MAKGTESVRTKPELKQPGSIAFVLLLPSTTLQILVYVIEHRLSMQLALHLRNTGIHHLCQLASGDLHKR